MNNQEVASKLFQLINQRKLAELKELTVEVAHCKEILLDSFRDEHTLEYGFDFGEVIYYGLPYELLTFIIDYMDVDRNVFLNNQSLRFLLQICVKYHLTVAVYICKKYSFTKAELMALPTLETGDINYGDKLPTREEVIEEYNYFTGELNFTLEELGNMFEVYFSDHCGVCGKLDDSFFIYQPAECGYVRHCMDCDLARVMAVK